jgi:hypothetical protein
MDAPPRFDADACSAARARDQSRKPRPFESRSWRAGVVAALLLVATTLVGVASGEPVRAS